MKKNSLPDIHHSSFCCRGVGGRPFFGRELHLVAFARDVYGLAGQNLESDNHVRIVHVTGEGDQMQFETEGPAADAAAAK